MLPSAIHILIVDDDLPSQILLRWALQKAGYTVQVAGTGEVALALHAAHPSDLVLLDVLLPDMNGFAVCAELRKHSQVPIIMLTALHRLTDITYGFSVGMDDYITKPYRLAQITLRMESVLRHRTWLFSE